jgi:hypothetical protein
VSFGLFNLIFQASFMAASAASAVLNLTDANVLFFKSRNGKMNF